MCKLVATAHEMCLYRVFALDKSAFHQPCRCLNITAPHVLWGWLLFPMSITVGSCNFGAEAKVVTPVYFVLPGKDLIIVSEEISLLGHFLVSR